ncbi:MAG: hypothetical protein WBK81_01065, partial [Bacteroidales bacterium]
NLLFKHVGRKKVTNSQIREELSHRVTDSNLICVKQKKEFKKAVKETKSKKVVVNKTQIRRGVYSVQVVDKHVSDFKVWLRRFRGVATKYLQSYLMWFVITHKYLTSEIESDIGRLLNLASSDRWAWDEYWRLVNTKYR